METCSSFETKTTDGIPDEPYGSWVEQLHTQIGLLHLAYPEAEIRGSILARDLNKGMEREFNGYSYNEQLFEYVLGKGVHIAPGKARRDKTISDAWPLVWVLRSPERLSRPSGRATPSTRSNHACRKAHRPQRTEEKD